MDKLITVTEYCNKYLKDTGNVRRFLLNGRMNGKKIGNQWLIEENEEYPKDKRIKSNKYINWRKTIQFNKGIKKALTEMSKRIVESNGGKIEKIIVYGSYARNEETSDSDIDVAIITNGKVNQDSLITVALNYELEMNKVISIVDIEKRKFRKYKDALPFYKNIEKEGIEIWTKN